MSLNSQMVIAPSLSEYYFDKTTGLPLEEGSIEFRSDVNRDEFKSIYRLSGSAPNYTYTELPNPLPLSAIGTPDDGDNNNIKPYLKPYDADGNVELYYVVVKNKDGVEQFTREAWPNTISAGNTTIEGITNFIPNPQFIFFNDIPETDTLPAGRIRQETTIIAQGGWTYNIPEGSTTQDVVTRTTYGVVTNPTGNPRYAVNVKCEIPDPSDSFKDLRKEFEDVNKFSSIDLDDKLTFSVTAVSNDSEDVEAELFIIRNFGTEGSAETRTSLGTFTITVTESIHNLSFNLAPNTGKTIGSDNDDYLQFAISFPTNSAFDVALTNFVLATGEIQLQEFPATTDGDVFCRSLVRKESSSDGMDLYLPLILTPYGVTFDDSQIGKVFADAVRDTPAVGELAMVSSQYETAAYSSHGIPYLRLQQKLWIDSLNAPRWGTGPDYFTAYINNASLVEIATNKAGSTTVIGAGTSGFTVATDHTGADYGVNGFAITGGLIVIDKTIGTCTAPTAGDSGFTVTVLRNVAVATHVFTIIPTVSTGLAGKYFEFSSTTTNYYMWFKVNGSGVDPAIVGRTGILLEVASGVPAQEMGRLIAEAISGFQISLVTQTAASSITGGTYFTVDAVDQGYYVWLTKDGVGTDPVVSGRKGIKVAVLTGDTQAQVGVKIQIAINSKYFGLPDWSKMFLRGKGANPLFDITSDNRFSLLGTLYGDELGTYQLDSFLSHSHGVTKSAAEIFTGMVQNGFGGTASPGGGADYRDITINVSDALNISINNTGTGETRPIDVYVNWFIKY